MAIRRQLSRSSGPRQLENLSKTLAESKGAQMEVPGQYLDVKEPMPAQHVKVERVLPDVEMADLNLACHRKIVIRGNDTKVCRVPASRSPRSSALARPRPLACVSAPAPLATEFLHLVLRRAEKADD